MEIHLNSTYVYRVRYSIPIGTQSRVSTAPGDFVV